jgi:hypothetical protein
MSADRRDAEGNERGETALLFWGMASRRNSRLDGGEIVWQTSIVDALCIWSATVLATTFLISHFDLFGLRRE